MKKYFRYIGSVAGRWLRAAIGFAIMAWGYSAYSYPAGFIMILVGALITSLAILNIAPLAPLFGYSVWGNRVTKRYGSINGVPGEDHGGKKTGTEFNEPSAPELKKMRKA